MSPFQLFAAGLVAGTLLQLTGLCMGWLCRHGHFPGRLFPPAGPTDLIGLPVWARVPLLCWAAGVATLLLVAAYDRDPTLFVGQALAAYGFWKTGWLKCA